MMTVYRAEHPLELAFDIRTYRVNTMFSRGRAPAEKAAPASLKHHNKGARASRGPQTRQRSVPARCNACIIRLAHQPGLQ